MKHLILMNWYFIMNLGFFLINSNDWKKGWKINVRVLLFFIIIIKDAVFQLYKTTMRN